ncbi:hypothetical protein ACFWXO_05480 [Kitasatospora sp. NPDC059088]|uniref:hypothetical protein n=1 Tax=Kitasatospora sp. NPDC059088 TaxID=3346722 RepID=UPI00369BC056
MRIIRRTFIAAVPALALAVIGLAPAHATTIRAGDYVCVGGSPAPRLVNNNIEWYAEVTCDGDGYGPKWVEASLERANCDGDFCTFSHVMGPLRSSGHDDFTRVSRVSSNADCKAAEPPRIAKGKFRVSADIFSDGGAKHETGMSDVAELPCA